MTVCHTKKWMPVSTKASDPTVLQWLFLFRRHYVGKTYLADRDVCKSNLSLCVCVTYDFDPVLPISDMQGTTHWALWYSQWLHRQTTSFQILPKFPPPHTISDIFLLNILSCSNYYTGISTSCSTCTSVGTVSEKASQVTYTMDTQISISLLNIRTRCWSSQEEAGEMKLEKHLIFACFAPSMKYRNDSCGNLVHFKLQLK